LQQYRWIIAIAVSIVAVAAAIELLMGRSFFGPDGRLGFWEGDIWSNENSQRFADPYSFSHIIHGMLFYGIFFLIARHLPVHYRFLMALGLEVSWEILENSPLIINRYREATISLGYVGDSVFNSMSDALMMSLGFLLARRLPLRVTLIAIVVMEVGCALWVRDNLTFNIIMLIHPVAAIKTWQAAGQPHP